MSDLIRRADAIEAAKEVLSGNVYWDYVCDAVNALSALPSAETHEIRTETHGVCLISKDDAMGAVQDHFNADGFKGYDDGQKMMDRIKALPSAEAVQGEWVHDGQNFKGGLDWCHCSECGYKTSMNGLSVYRYCPNCGTKMKEGAE